MLWLECSSRLTFMRHSPVASHRPSLRSTHYTHLETVRGNKLQLDSDSFLMGMMPGWFVQNQQSLFNI